MMRPRARIALALVVLLVGWATVATAQSDFKVVAVEVEGNRAASESLILGVASIHLGSQLTPAVITETIQRLYGLGIFSDVRIDADETLGGLKVIVVVTERPKLIGLEFEGSDKVSAKDLREKLGLGVGGYISPYLIHQKAVQIRDLFSEKGYFQAEVSHTLTYNKDSTEVSLRFTTDARSKVKVENVVLKGAHAVKAKDLIKKMRNRKRGFLKSSDFAKDKYEEDLEKVIAKLHSEGHIDAYMISDSTNIDSIRNKMTIYLDLYEGPRYYFGKATFSGNTELPEFVLTKALRFKEGEIFDEGKYEESMFEISSAYYEIGHLHINVFDERTTRADSIVDISYSVTEGLPSHISMVRIVGNTKTKDKVVRREISVLPGQKFNRSLLIRSVRDCMALNYFTNVVPTPVNLPNGDVDIEFAIEEKQTAQISAGAGYNSRDKVVGNVGVGIPNFRGNGQNVAASVDFGGRVNSFNISFTEPWLMGRPTLLGVNAFATNRQWFSSYTEGRRGGSLRLGKRLRWPDNYFRASTSFLLEQNRFHDYDSSFVQINSERTTSTYNYTKTVDPDTPLGDTTFVDTTETRVTYGDPIPGSILDVYGEGWKTASRLSFTITRDSRNLPEFATSGSKFVYSFANTGGILGGFWKYQKHSISYSKFIPLFWKVSLGTKIQYAVVTSPAGDDRISLSDRFTPGGTAYDGVVRGFRDGTLTPDTARIFVDTTRFYTGDPDGSPVLDSLKDTTIVDNVNLARVRGNYMLVGNVELQIPIIERQIYALLFYDIGNSWLHRRDISFSSMAQGVGVGFRVQIPGMGTLGFDFGYPLDRYRNEEQKWQTHFQIGSIFR